MQPTRILTSGGMFSTTSQPRVNYSKDTQDFVKVLMKEAHLTNLQKNGFHERLRTGDSLPSNSHEMMKQRFQIMKQRFQSKRQAMGEALGLRSSAQYQKSSGRRSSHPSGSGRRSLDSIKASGAYDPSPQRPYVAPVNKEKEIARLQHHMAYGTTKPSEATLLKEKPKETSIEDEKMNRFAEIVDEIGDRIDFLKSMHQIGRDKVYRSMIEFQIREKLTELEQNYPQDVEAVVQHFGLHKFMTKIELP